jgi:hypothetical protein
MIKYSFKQYLIAACLIILSAILFYSKAYANNVGNGGFEEPIGNSTAQNWDSTNGATRFTNATKPAGGFSNVPVGVYALGIPSGSYTFQVFNGAKAGDYVTFSALTESSIPGIAGGRGGQIVIEYKHANPDGSDTTISTTQSAYINPISIAGSFAAPPGGGFRRISVSGIAPKETNRIVFTLRTMNGGGGTVVFDDVNGEVNPVKNLTVVASRNQVRKGEPVALHASFTNAAATTLNATSMIVDIPKGFDPVVSTVRVNGQKTETREGSLIVSMGNLAPGVTVPVEFVVIPTTGVTPGKYYGFTFHVKDGNGNVLTDPVYLQLRVIADSVFDEGTIIGKVFNDTNQNGVQDECEKGVPYAMLATEYGVTVVTDENGKYHIPAVRPGRHLVKIDGHGLPEGTKFITEETYLVKMTPGILAKANFAVLLPPDATPQEFQEDLIVNVSQGMDTTRPNLEVKMDQELLKVGLEMLEKQPIFKFRVNYPDMVKNWFLEIRDDLGQPVWTGFGVGAPPAEVMWNGKTETGLIIKPGIYSYQLKLQDNKGREDWSLLHLFQVVSKANFDAKELSPLMFPEVGDFNIFKDGKQTIPLVAKPTVRIQGITKPANKVTVNGYPVDVNPETGSYLTELYVNPGEKEFLVEATSPEGETVSVRKKITVKDSTFFMVGLGEQQLGYNFKGADETVGGEDTMKKAFYEDGRLSYYLRGKLKGKFLIKSRYDTGDKKDALFTNLDPEKYYPVYGDASTINYEGQDTQDRMFCVVEMDKSFAKWGSFKTDFKDTELATYNRTLSGLKIDYNTVGTTPYGDAKRGFKIFYTKAQFRAAHNEFAATGGSLYYLRNRLIKEGSEKIRIEVRDQLQHMAVQSTDLTVGKDYTINYEQGRIMLNRPLSSVASSQTLSSVDPLNGDQVYLVVDYEYDAGYSITENKNRGVRGFAHMGDHIRVGGTAIEEARAEGDYQLRGVDLMTKWGRNTKISAEYAQTINQQMNQNVSYNGGLSFADLAPIHGQQTKDEEDAYLIKAESKPLDKLETSGYVQKVNGGFSNTQSRSQEGTNKYGVNARYKFTDVFYARYRFDANDLAHQLRPPENNGIQAPYLESQTHTAQLVYDDKKYLGHLEYQKRNDKFPTDSAMLPTVDTQYQTGDIIAGKLGYRINERLLPYVRAQATIDRRSYYAGGGLEYQLINNLFAHVEELFGNLGNATLFGLERISQDGTRSYANIKMTDQGMGMNPQTLATTIGGSMPFTDQSRLYSEKEQSTFNGQNNYADILGYQGKMNEHWDYDLKYEQRRLKSSWSRALEQQADNSLLRANTFNTVSGTLAYANREKLKARSTLELRKDYDGPSMWQIVAREYMDYKINQDLSYLAKLDYGISRFEDPSDTPAEFMEFNNGFAYRPVYCDKLNFLTRYTYTHNLGNDLQYYYSDATNTFNPDETAHIAALDLAYDVHRYFGIVEKLGYKLATLTTSLADQAVLHTFLYAHRFNFHVTRKWDVALEYRIMFQSDAAQNLSTGPLFEVDREFYDYVRLGAGYNFTHFDDDLRKSANYDAHGPFVRVTGKF